MSDYPPLDVFDENDQPIGSAMLDEILEKGLIHRVAHIIVEDDQGRVLLQLRGPNARTDPGCWGFSAEGYVDPGEDYTEAAYRELHEELGLNGVKLEKLSVIREHEAVSGYNVNRFTGTFRAVLPVGTKMRLEKTEVADVRWFTLAELKEHITADPKLPPYMRKWLKEFYFGDEDHEH